MKFVKFVLVWEFFLDWHGYHVYVPCLIFVGTTSIGILSIYQWIFRRFVKWGEIYAFTLKSIKKKKKLLSFFLQMKDLWKIV